MEELDSSSKVVSGSSLLEQLTQKKNRTRRSIARIKFWAGL